MAKNPNTITYTIDDDDSNTNVYISCLNREVDVLWTNITITYRDFETPSGNYHYLERWEWDTVFTATDGSGDTWIGTGFSPGTYHAISEGGEVTQFTSHDSVRPVGDNDSPSLKYSWVFKYTINANGEVTADFGPPEDMSDWNIRCVGPKGKKEK